MEKENTNLTHIGIFDDVIPSEKCQEIIEQFKLNKNRHRKGNVNGGHYWEGKITTDWNICSNLDKDIDTFIYKTFSNCFKNYIEKFKISHSSLPNTICDSGYKVMKYIKGTGKFDIHIDNSFKATPNRFLTALLYLNTVEEGGETEFPSQGITIKAKVGRVVMFPPFFTHPHKGNTPLSGNKYVINSFFMGSK
tara:strand:- start:3954 stop:4532 length:579 start_codon:yes stop_codon:yes gene_type:complete